MSKLQELINELCPNGMEYMKVGDVTYYEQPTKYIVKSTNYNDDFNTPVLTAGQSFILGYTNETDGIFEATKQEPVIIFDDFTGAFKWVDFPFKVKSSAMKLITSNEDIVLLRFLYHIMGAIGLTSTEHKRLWLSKYSEIKIPVPPLPVQEEIVKILDKMTDYVAELKAEQKARKMQYEYYRDELLTFDDSITRVTLKDICKNICSGGTPNTSNKNFYGGDIPWLRTQEVDWEDIHDTELKITQTGLDNSSAKWIPEDCLIIAMYGATAAKAAINRIPLTTNQACCNLEIDNEKADLRYVFHWMNKEYYNLKKMGQGTQSNINAGIIRNYPIFLPPLADQKRIANILDKFNALIKNTDSGLPAEIEARQKQYEYYRDKLLSFQKLENEEC